ncbi:LOB domain-containing protein 40 [Hordeum vulgare]|uniref:Predicted protein n=1 Tax=Hordeum vulgare subsp. vulgare TaxID=112509 RepID=F2DDE6_HORVV|nr:LOB domain-containing protein 40-like [Hordeum vulgare subsp. vulgare]KAE8805633.1 LOB domain-containing protein 40 [Hordeum vulgare]KAI5012895.1 hypothetical protein ZWY2020_025161 [Hordeum vulgare]BAJ93117.1 predicted protein [Hordeum vulgare subsp. vulgare]
MRLSCNGCRVLRKGCSEDCSIRPCLQWIKSPEAQANATVFLAKFYGRAGLMNLINAGTDDSLRPGIFRSLLYEACGRIVNPIYGSVGLLWSNNWQMCQAAVEAVLSGKPIVQVSSEDAAADRTPPLKAYDIRHVSTSPAADGRLHKVAKPGRTRFKRASSASSHHNPSSDSNNKPKPQPRPPTAEEELDRQHRKEMEEGAFQRAPSHESSDSRHEDPVEPHSQQEASADTEAEAGSHVSQAEQEQEQSTEPAADHAEEVEKDDEELGLELTLGFAPVAARPAGCHLSVRTAAEPAFVGLRFL